jgi:hypothetical protein
VPTTNYTPITKQLLADLPYGTVLHYGPACTEKRQERWRTNGQLKTWKRPPRDKDFQQPIKHGLRDYSYLDESNAHNFHLERECPYA